MAYREFCTNYLVLDAEKASVFDIFRILYSKDIHKKDFIDIPEGKTIGDFPERLLMFLSALAMKALVLLKGPMEAIGSMVERWLNYPAANGGFFQLLLKLLTGRVVKPDRTSCTYASLIGLLDTRVDLDKNLSKGDAKYDAALSIMAAKLSYENEAFVGKVISSHWQMKLLNFYNFWNAYQEQYATQAIVFQDTNSDPNLVVVAFRGTEPYNADDWITDVNLTFYEFDKTVGQIHAGFMQALGLQKGLLPWPKEIIQDKKKPYAYYTIRNQLRSIINDNQDTRIIVTGHSLGGALAILFPAILFYHQETALLQKFRGVFTFGQPRVGNVTFAEYMKNNLSNYGMRYNRYVYNNDIVPRVPFDDRDIFYKHFAPSLFYNSCYKGKVLEDAPNKNYFSPLWILPMYISAIYEIIRSFIIPLTRGSEYREGIVQILFRLVGLVLPGLPNHGPQDYDNLTRLGASPSSLLYKAKRSALVKLLDNY